MNSIAKVIRRQVGRVVKKPGAPAWRVVALCDEAKRSIPEADFVSARFDRDAGTPPSRMIVILSTPRSGSTYLCQLLHDAGLCTAHEYLQPYQYLPILAERWGCIDNGRVSCERYVAALERHRTSDEGVLGINLHGAHMRRFAAALPYFSASDVRYVWLQRRDKLGQAVSLAIAEQTTQWSSQFEKKRDAEYDFDFFRKRLEIIHEQEATVRAFLRTRPIDCDVLVYEDFVEDLRAALEPLFGVDLGAALARREQALRPQRSSVNDDFVRRLAADLVRGSAI
jgi:LPS sulfotransferase NodH